MSRSTRCCALISFCDPITFALTRAAFVLDATPYLCNYRYLGGRIHTRRRNHRICIAGVHLYAAGFTRTDIEDQAQQCMSDGFWRTISR